MTANGTGAASSKTLQKATRTAALAEADTKNKAAQSVRDPPEAATPSGEDPVPTRTLKARAANVYNAEWAPHEQAALDQAAVKFPADRYQAFERYVRIAATLPRKGVRDVALRLRWLNQARKRKVSEEGPNKRLRRDRCHSIFATQQKPANMMQQWPQPQLPMPQLDDHGAQTVGAVGGLVAQLLEQNLHILYQYKQNMHQFKVQENTELLVRFRDNILAVLNQMSSMDGVMSQMPQLPVRMNVELANNFLPPMPGDTPCTLLCLPCCETCCPLINSLAVFLCSTYCLPCTSALQAQRCQAGFLSHRTCMTIIWDVQMSTQCCMSFKSGCSGS